MRVNKSTSIINLKDFIKLKSNICNEGVDNVKKEREDHLRKLSQEKLKKWPDSIEQIKKKEIEMRKYRFFEEESERRKVDDEEAKYQKIKKQIILVDLFTHLDSLSILLVCGYTRVVGGLCIFYKY